MNLVGNGSDFVIDHNFVRTVWPVVFSEHTRPATDPLTIQRIVDGTPPGELPKVCWMLWLTGWDQSGNTTCKHNANERCDVTSRWRYNTPPYMARMALESWRHHNPEWAIVQISWANVGKYVNLTRVSTKLKEQAASDIIRLHLLAKYGGIWADATVLCMHSVEYWAFNATRSAGFWMYFDRPPALYKESFPLSSFILAAKDSVVLRAWNKASDQMWMKLSRPQGTNSYFWMNTLFNRIRGNASINKLVARVAPFIPWGKGVGPALLQGRVSAPVSQGCKADIDEHPPHILKLDKYLQPPRSLKSCTAQNVSCSGGHYAINRSLRHLGS